MSSYFVFPSDVIPAVTVANLLHGTVIRYIHPAMGDPNTLEGISPSDLRPRAFAALQTILPAEFGGETQATTNINDPSFVWPDSLTPIYAYRLVWVNPHDGDRLVTSAHSDAGFLNNTTVGALVSDLRLIENVPSHGVASDSRVLVAEVWRQADNTSPIVVDQYVPLVTVALLPKQLRTDLAFEDSSTQLVPLAAYDTTSESVVAGFYRLPASDTLEYGGQPIVLRLPFLGGAIGTDIKVRLVWYSTKYLARLDFVNEWVPPTQVDPPAKGGRLLTRDAAAILGEVPAADTDEPYLDVVLRPESSETPYVRDWSDLAGWEDAVPVPFRGRQSKFRPGTHAVAGDAFAIVISGLSYARSQEVINAFSDVVPQIVTVSEGCEGTETLVPLTPDVARDAGSVGITAVLTANVKPWRDVTNAELGFASPTLTTTYKSAPAGSNFTVEIRRNDDLSQPMLLKLELGRDFRYLFPTAVSTVPVGQGLATTGTSTEYGAPTFQDVTMAAGEAVKLVTLAMPADTAAPTSDAFPAGVYPPLSGRRVTLRLAATSPEFEPYYSQVFVDNGTVALWESCDATGWADILPADTLLALWGSNLQDANGALFDHTRTNNAITSPVTLTQDPVPDAGLAASTPFCTRRERGQQSYAESGREYFYRGHAQNVSPSLTYEFPNDWAVSFRMGAERFQIPFQTVDDLPYLWTADVLQDAAIYVMGVGGHFHVVIDQQGRFRLAKVETDGSWTLDVFSAWSIGEANSILPMNARDVTFNFVRTGGSNATLSWFVDGDLRYTTSIDWADEIASGLTTTAASIGVFYFPSNARTLVGGTGEPDAMHAYNRFLAEVTWWKQPLSAAFAECFHIGDTPLTGYRPSIWVTKYPSGTYTTGRLHRIFVHRTGPSDAILAPSTPYAMEFEANAPLDRTNVWVEGLGIAASQTKDMSFIAGQYTQEFFSYAMGAGNSFLSVTLSESGRSYGLQLVSTYVDDVDEADPSYSLLSKAISVGDHYDPLENLNYADGYLPVYYRYCEDDRQYLAVVVPTGIQAPGWTYVPPIRVTMVMPQSDGFGSLAYRGAVEIGGNMPTTGKAFRALKAVASTGEDVPGSSLVVVPDLYRDGNVALFTINRVPASSPELAGRMTMLFEIVGDVNENVGGIVVDVSVAKVWVSMPTNLGRGMLTTDNGGYGQVARRTYQYDVSLPATDWVVWQNTSGIVVPDVFCVPQGTHLVVPWDPCTAVGDNQTFTAEYNAVGRITELDLSPFRYEGPVVPKFLDIVMNVASKELALSTFNDVTYSCETPVVIPQTGYCVIYAWLRVSPTPESLLTGSGEETYIDQGAMLQSYLDAGDPHFLAEIDTKALPATLTDISFRLTCLKPQLVGDLLNEHKLSDDIWRLSMMVAVLPANDTQLVAMRCVPGMAALRFEELGVATFGNTPAAVGEEDNVILSAAAEGDPRAITVRDSLGASHAFEFTAAALLETPSLVINYLNTSASREISWITAARGLNRTAFPVTRKSGNVWFDRAWNISFVLEGLGDAEHFEVLRIGSTFAVTIEDRILRVTGANGTFVEFTDTPIAGGRVFIHLTTLAWWNSVVANEPLTAVSLYASPFVNGGATVWGPIPPNVNDLAIRPNAVSLGDVRLPATGNYNTWIGRSFVRNVSDALVRNPSPSARLANLTMRQGFMQQAAPRYPYWSELAGTAVQVLQVPDAFTGDYVDPDDSLYVVRSGNASVGNSFFYVHAPGDSFPVLPETDPNISQVVSISVGVGTLSPRYGGTAGAIGTPFLYLNLEDQLSTYQVSSLAAIDDPDSDATPILRTRPDCLPVPRLRVIPGTITVSDGEAAVVTLDRLDVPLTDPLTVSLSQSPTSPTVTASSLTFAADSQSLVVSLTASVGVYALTFSVAGLAAASVLLTVEEAEIVDPPPPPPPPPVGTKALTWIASDGPLYIADGGEASWGVVRTSQDVGTALQYAVRVYRDSDDVLLATYQSVLGDVSPFAAGQLSQLVTLIGIEQGLLRAEATAVGYETAVLDILVYDPLDPPPTPDPPVYPPELYTLAFVPSTLTLGNGDSSIVTLRREAVLSESSLSVTVTRTQGGLPIGSPVVVTLPAGQQDVDLVISSDGGGVTQFTAAASGYSSGQLTVTVLDTPGEEEPPINPPSEVVPAQPETAIKFLVPLSIDVLGSLALQARTSEYVVSSFVYPGNPEGQLVATPGSTCTDPANGVYYVKRSGTGASGWRKVVLEQ